MDIIELAIVEDEKIQIELLKRYVRKWESKKDVKVNIEEFYNAESFEFKWSMDKKYEILLLDIQMSAQSGIELAKKIRKKDKYINIIFITAIVDYIQEGYDVEAINYLIKPIKEEKLYECLNKAMNKIPKKEKTIIVNMDGEFCKINQNDILYIEASAHCIEINTNKRKYTTRKNISAIEKELDKKMFVKCHRSYIVALRYVKRIGSSNLELDNGNSIPISRRRYSDTNKAFIKYYRGEVNE